RTAPIHNRKVGDLHAKDDWIFAVVLACTGVPGKCGRAREARDVTTEGADDYARVGEAGEVRAAPCKDRECICQRDGRCQVAATLFCDGFADRSTALAVL